MTDNDNDEQDIDLDRQEIVHGMSRDDLDMLTDEQMEMVTDIAVKRSNSRARERVREALGEEEKSVLSALTSPPFTYTSPEIRIAPGFEVRFTTLVHAQLRDAHDSLDSFIRIERPNEIRVSDFFNRHLVAHSLSQLNGADFAGIVFDASAYSDLRRNSADDAKKLLAKVRDDRLQAIDELSPHLVDRLIAYYIAFQAEVESVTNSDGVTEDLGN